MALDSYANLQTAIAGWLHHETLAPAQLQEFIRLAEERITGDLAECAFMQVSPSPIALAAAATGFTLPLEANSLIAARLVELDQPLAVVSSNQLKRQASSASGVPGACAISGGTDAGLLNVAVWPAPSSAYTVQVTYTRAVPALSDARPSNFILARAPSLYLYGSLLQGEGWGVNDARMTTWQAMYDAALSRFRGLGWDGNAMLTTDLPVTGRAFDITRGY